MGPREGRTCLAINVVNAIAVVDGDGPVADEPGHEAAEVYVEDGDVAGDEEEELQQVEAHDRMPQPCADRLPRLVMSWCKTRTR